MWPESIIGDVQSYRLMTMVVKQAKFENKNECRLLANDVCHIEKEVETKGGLK